MNRFSIANNILFTALLLASPVVFGTMFLGSGSVLAAISAAVAYLSLVIGERVVLLVQCGFYHRHVFFAVFKLL